MLKQVVQDKDVAHRRLVKDRSILRRFVQDKTLQSESRKSVRVYPQMSRQVVQDEDPGHGHCVQDRYPLPGRFVRDPGNSSETKRVRTTTSNLLGIVPKYPRGWSPNA